MKKKIAFIIQHLTNGGAERTISNLSLALKDEYDISLIVFDGNNVTYPYAGKMIDLELPPVEGGIQKIINSYRRIKKTKAIRKQENFDCVVSFMFGANIVNVMSRCGEKVIVSARNYMSAYGLNRKAILRERFIAKRADKEIALSKMVEYDLVENFKIPSHKVLTIYNPCDVQRIGKLAQQPCPYTFDDDTFYVVSAGRFVKQKGQWRLLKAFSEFHKEVPKSRLILLGDGELKEDLVRLSKELSIEEYVDFVGFVDNPYCYMSKSSCFVLSSLFEGLGNVIIEAMACQIPVISFDCLAGPRELIGPETQVSKRCDGIEWCTCGVLVKAPESKVDFSIEKDNVDLLMAKAMKEVYMNKAEALCCVKNADERIKAFDPQIITKEWSRIFQE